MKMTVKPILFGALGTVPKNLEKRLEELEIKGRIETTALQKLTRIFRNVLETRRILLLVWIQWKTTI